jgi:uncharacterized OB-fold protein
MSEPDFTHAEYTATLAQKKLVGSRCQQCGRTYLPPRPLCPHCHSKDMMPLEFSGKGKLAAYSVIYYGPTFMKNYGYGPKNPYVSGVIDLEEGPRVSAQVLGLDMEHPESIRIGTSLRVTFIEREENGSKKVFLGFEALD